MSYPIAPETVFQAEYNYSIEEICELTRLPRGLVERAAEAREIACVCTLRRDGLGKCWKGAKIAAWIRRAGLPIDPPERVRRTCGVKSEAQNPKF